MALSSTVIRRAANTFIGGLISTVDADTGPLVVPHFLGSVPLEVWIAPVQVEHWTSAWIISDVDDTNIDMLAANAVGSGVAGVQTWVFARVDPYRTR